MGKPAVASQQQRTACACPCVVMSPCARRLLPRSNFFVLAADGAVETAEEGVLSGTVRELVLQVRARHEGR